MAGQKTERRAGVVEQRQIEDRQHFVGLTIDQRTAGQPLAARSSTTITSDSHSQRSGERIGSLPAEGVSVAGPCEEDVMLPSCRK